MGGSRSAWPITPSWPPEDRMIEIAPATLAEAIEWMKLMLLDCLHE
jgi:hypothetical protein